MSGRFFSKTRCSDDDNVGPRNHVLDGGPDGTNPFASVGVTSRRWGFSSKFWPFLMLSLTTGMHRCSFLTSSMVRALILLKSLALYKPFIYLLTYLPINTVDVTFIINIWTSSSSTNEHRCIPVVKKPRIDSDFDSKIKLMTIDRTPLGLDGNSES